MRRHLVIVTAGSDSIHEHICEGRNFDLWVLYWGTDDACAARFAKTADRLIRAKGYKWQLIREIATDLAAWRKSSSAGRILLLDDDITFPRGAADVSNMFRYSDELGADISQAAITNDNISWPCTARLPNAHCHAVSAVESMMPVFADRILFDVVLPGLWALPHIQFGWFFEFFVVRFSEALLQRPVRAFVIDATGVEHTRKPGTGASPQSGGWDEAFMLPGLAGMAPRTFAAFDNAGAAVAYQFPSSELAADIRDRVAQVALGRRLAQLNVNWTRPRSVLKRAATQILRRQNFV